MRIERDNMDQVCEQCSRNICDECGEQFPERPVVRPTEQVLIELAQLMVILRGIHEFLEAVGAL